MDALPIFRHADQQAYRWLAAFRMKKSAMESLLRAQKSLEDIEASIGHHIAREVIENTHTQFLSALDPSIPEASYLSTIGRAVVHPSLYVVHGNFRS